jgi:hypothetical protein
MRLEDWIGLDWIIRKNGFDKHGHTGPNNMEKQDMCDTQLGRAFSQNCFIVAE